MSTIPDPVERPALARWMWDRKLKPRHAEAPLGITGEQVRRYCLEFGHPDRAIPPQAVLERIVAWTQGAITAADFYPPHLQRQPAEPAEVVQP
jgi:hypothetical protein